jgi:hypothetical protein
MKRCLICLALTMLSLPVLAQDYLPRDVQRFMDRRTGCDHIRGEMPDPDQKLRMNEVSRELRKLCGGTDKELVQLKRKYAANSTIMQILTQFDSGIEAAEAPAPKSGAVKRTG